MIGQTGINCCSILNHPKKKSGGTVLADLLLVAASTKAFYRSIEEPQCVSVKHASTLVSSSPDN